MYPMVKRSLDIALSLAALLLLLPLLALIAAAIRLETPGSPLFFQQRVGRSGRPFYMVKFRSMVKDAPKLGSWRTEDNDPRITRTGMFIRRTSIDELPQLWNVLTGDMSLIGPRPQTPAQESLYTPAQWQARHIVRPGITGLAQVNGRSALDFESATKFDLAYAARPSFAQDMHILLATIHQVLRGVGVN